MLRTIFHQHRHGVEVIQGFLEEALHLLRVQIHGHKAVGAGQLHALGAHARADGDARFVLFVALCIGKVGHDQRYRQRVGALEGVHPEEYLDKFVVGVHADGLHKIHVAVADGFVDADERIALRKGDHFRVAHLAAHITAHALGERLSAAAREDGYICAVKHPEHSFASVRARGDVRRERHIHAV